MQIRQITNSAIFNNPTKIHLWTTCYTNQPKNHLLVTISGYPTYPGY